MTTYTQEELDNLEPAEREALLNEPNDEGTTLTLGESLRASMAAQEGDTETEGETDVNKGAAAGKEGGEGDGDPAGEGDEGAAVDAAGKAGAAENGDAAGGDDAGNGGGDGDGADAAASRAAAAPEIIEPILVAEFPENHEARLKAFKDDKKATLDAYENGDITTSEYHEKLEAISEEQRKLERAVDKAEMARDAYQQQHVNNWKAQVKHFTTQTHPEYGSSTVRYQALDHFVRQVGADPASQGLSAMEIFEKAHQMVEADLGVAAKTKVAEPKADIKDKKGPLKGSKPAAPQTLRNAPASAGEDVSTDSGKFAALDRLRESNWEAHEEALMRMSESERDRYLAHG
jgi:hypothetical protein